MSDISLLPTTLRQQERKELKKVTTTQQANPTAETGNEGNISEDELLGM